MTTNLAHKAGVELAVSEIEAAKPCPKPEKRAKHRHQWRRGPNGICLICGKKKPPKSERTILEKELWDATAEYVKKRDGCCVTCGTTDKLTISHWIPAGKQILRYDLHNCNCQCSSCNNAHNNYKYFYDDYILKTYGNAEFLRMTKQAINFDSWKWSINELREMLAEMRQRLEDLG